MDTSLIQVPEKQYAYANASKQAEYLKTMSKKAIGGYNYKNDDPTMSEYFGLTNEVPSNMVGWNTNVPMKKVDVEVEVPDPADPSKKIKKNGTTRRYGRIEEVQPKRSQRWGKIQNQGSNFVRLEIQ